MWRSSQRRTGPARTKRWPPPLPLWVHNRLPPPTDSIIPLESNALAMRFITLRPGPDLAMKRPEHEAAQSELIEPPSVIERRLRARLAELVGAQAVEDEKGRRA